MVQKKHKKRKHNKKSPAQSVDQAASVDSKDEAKKGFLASRKSEDKDKKAVKKSEKSSSNKNEKPGLWRRFTDYCKAVRGEMRRVVWPTRQELVNASLIVVGAIIFFGVYIAIIDNIIIIPLDWIASLGA